MEDADEQLFRRIMNNSEHVLQPFFPDRPVLSYSLRQRPHCNKSLITKTVDLSNNDYIIREPTNTATDTTSNQTILPFYSYLFNISQFPFFSFLLYYGCVCQLFNKREMMMMMAL